MALNGWKERLFQRYLHWICRPARVAGHLRREIARRRERPAVDRRRIRVAALQLAAGLVSEPLEYAGEMHRRVREAAETGAHLAVFPEYNNLKLLGILPGAEKFGLSAEENGRQKGGREAEISLADVIFYAGPALQALVHATFSTLAEAYGLFIMAGSHLVPENRRIRNRAFLYGPGGQILGFQDKVHLLPVEEEIGITPGEGFSVFDTKLGRLAMPVCMDASYFETFRILEKMGAEVALLPIANNEPYDYWLALRGIWPRVQECPMYGVKSALVGTVPGFSFTGRAGIFAPLELTPDGDGVLAEVQSPHQEGMAVADLDLEALARLRADHPWRDTNSALYRRYFPAVYSAGAWGRGHSGT